MSNECEADALNGKCTPCAMCAPSPHTFDNEIFQQCFLKINGPIDWWNVNAWRTYLTSHLMELMVLDVLCLLKWKIFNALILLSDVGVVRIRFAIWFSVYCSVHCTVYTLAGYLCVAFWGRNTHPYFVVIRTHVTPNATAVIVVYSNNKIYKWLMCIVCSSSKCMYMLPLPLLMHTYLYSTAQTCIFSQLFCCECVFDIIITHLVANMYAQYIVKLLN